MVARAGPEPRDPGARTRRSPVVAVVGGAVALAVVALPTWWVATRDSNFAMPTSATSDGDQVVGVWRLLLAMATAVGSLVLVLLVVGVVTGARRRDASQTKGSIPLEVTYTAVPLLLVGVIFGASIWTSDRMGEKVADPQVVVDVEAFRWGWRFH